MEMVPSVVAAFFGAWKLSKTCTPAAIKITRPTVKLPRIAKRVLKPMIFPWFPNVRQFSLPILTRECPINLGPMIFTWFSHDFPAGPARKKQSRCLLARHHDVLLHHGGLAGGHLQRLWCRRLRYFSPWWIRWINTETMRTPRTPIVECRLFKYIMKYNALDISTPEMICRYISVVPFYRIP